MVMVKETMAEKLSDSANVHLGHHQSTGEGVPVAMPGVVFDPASLKWTGASPAHFGAPSHKFRTGEDGRMTGDIRRTCLTATSAAIRNSIQRDVTDTPVPGLRQRQDAPLEIDLAPLKPNCSPALIRRGISRPPKKRMRPSCLILPVPYGSGHHDRMTEVFRFNQYNQ